MSSEFRKEFFSGNRKGAVLVMLYRVAHWSACAPMIIRIICFPYLIFYHIFVRDIMAFDVHEKAVIGRNFHPWHCFGIVINPYVKIGDNVTIRQNTTIGNKNKLDDVPIIGNNVNIGCNVCVIGPVVVGDNSTIGAGSVVVKDVPSSSVVCGNPARVIVK